MHQYATPLRIRFDPGDVCPTHAPHIYNRAYSFAQYCCYRSVAAIHPHESQCLQVTGQCIWDAEHDICEHAQMQHLRSAMQSICDIVAIAIAHSAHALIRQTGTMLTCRCEYSELLQSPGTLPHRSDLARCACAHHQNLPPLALPPFGARHPLQHRGLGLPPCPEGGPRRWPLGLTSPSHTLWLHSLHQLRPSLETASQRLMHPLCIAIRLSEDGLQIHNPACKTPGADALPEMQSLKGGSMTSSNVLLC